MTSEREIVSSNQKTTGTRGFPTGCFAYADDELSGKLVFSGAREGVSIGLSKSSSIHLSVKYLWLLVGNWAPLCLVIGHIKFWSKNTLSTFAAIIHRLFFYCVRCQKNPYEIFTFSCILA